VQTDSYPCAYIFRSRSVHFKTLRLFLCKTSTLSNFPVPHHPIAKISQLIVPQEEQEKSSSKAGNNRTRHMDTQYYQIRILLFVYEGFAFSFNKLLFIKNNITKEEVQTEKRNGMRIKPLGLFRQTF
jgi:hypothetical protein